MRICSIEDCGGKHRAHGLCHKHYQRLLAHGNPHTILIDTHPTKGAKREPRLCSADGCDTPATTRRLCSHHYYIKQRTDNAMYMPPPPGKEQIRHESNLRGLERLLTARRRRIERTNRLLTR